MRFPQLFIAALLATAALLSACSSDDNGDDLTDLDAGEDTSDATEITTICEAGESRCDGVDNVEVCSDDGQEWEQSPCSSGERCNQATGRCTEQICSPGQFDQCTDDGKQRYCDVTGTSWVEDDCPGGATCTDGACPDPECQAETTRCIARDTIETCNAAGAYSPSTICPSGTECFDGECEELCEISTKVSSYMGCEYWSVDLDNFEDALSQPHAIILTNPNDELDATIRLFEGFTDRQLLEDSNGDPIDGTIPPGEARIYSIPVGYDHSGTRKFQDKAIRVTSSIPVVAHQFNPLNNVDVYSNDGTLLLPTNSVGTEYWGMSWYHRGGGVRIRGYLTIVNSSGSTNEVTVRPSAEVVSGPNIPTISAGEERVFSLEPGESLNLSTSGVELSDAESHGCLSDAEGQPENVSPCPDLTGTHIKAEFPITVFGGHQCGNVLLGVDRCDHIESILLPVEAWGTSHVGSKFFPRAEGSLPEPDFFRVMAAEDNTRLQTDPPIEGIHERRLDAGEWVQFPARQHFEIAAEKPIQMAQYMVGANWQGIPRICDEGIDAWNPTGIGDPAMAIAVPNDQFRDNYIVHSPQNYRDDYLNVIVPTGYDVTLDGETIAPSKWVPVGTRNRYEVATIKVDAGFHTLESDVPFGVVGYGYDCHVSYASPGGLDLEPIE